MSRNRIPMHRLQELVRLHRLGTAPREVARLLAISPNTERGYRTSLASCGLLDGPVDDLPPLEVLRAAVPRTLPQQQVSSVSDWEPAVRRLVEKGCQPRAIYDHLAREASGFEGSYHAVKRLVKRIRRERGVQPEDVAIPVETAAGEVAQVDFGYVGYLFDPVTQVRRKAWVFVLVLGHSRHQFARVTFDQRAETWQRLHAEAFAFFGGVPATVVPDNLKAAVLRAAFGIHDDVGLNRSYCELARHYGFTIDPCPPKDPSKKGKVEAGVKYVKRNFFEPRDPGEPITEANAALTAWTLQTAGRRIHGTTGRRPVEVFETEERGSLLPLPPLGWAPVSWKKAKVHRDCHVVFDKRLYSVPWRHVGRDAWVKATPDAVMVYVDDERVATHERRGAGPRSTQDAHLPVGRADLRHRGRPYWEARGRALGEEVGTWVSETFDTAGPLSPLRTVQAVVTYLEQHPRDRANNACRRARAFGLREYRGIKDILLKGLDLAPLPQPLLSPPLPAEPPRFARSAAQLVASYRSGVL